MAEVIIKDLVKEYHGDKKETFLAVRGISLDIKDQEFMVLVGPSGCGKSTTLRMVAGLEEISGGTISIGDTIVNEVQPKDRGIAMVFQNYALYPHMSVFDNMAFGLKLMKFPKDEVRKRVEEAAETLGLTTMLDRKPKALSGGQRQRVAVGRAIVRKPKVFLFDEPLSNLDAKMRVQMRAEISKLHHKLNATMIYVTHDQTEAMTMGDRICVMKDGDIMQVDTPLEIYNNPLSMFVASFIGSPPMNFIHGTIRSQGGDLEFVEAFEGGDGLVVKLNASLSKIAKNYIGKPIVFGVRPEHIVICESGAQNACRANVEVAEPMGAETFIYFNSGAHTFIARIGTDHPYRYGDECSLSFDQEKVKFFDPESEQVL